MGISETLEETLEEGDFEVRIKKDKKYLISVQ